jgi:hypothetical protein
VVRPKHKEGDMEVEETYFMCDEKNILKRWKMNCKEFFETTIHIVNVKTAPANFNNGKNASISNQN